MKTLQCFLPAFCNVAGDGGDQKQDLHLGAHAKYLSGESMDVQIPKALSSEWSGVANLGSLKA